jgi:intracellular sulfur oxidation DsrE/DsrF family protein
MKKRFLSVAFLCVLSCFSHGQNKIFPVIQHYGGVYDVPYAVDKPDPKIDYKIVVEAEGAIEHPDSIYRPLENFARLYNLHIYGGVSPKHLHVDVVIFFKAAFVILNNEAYKKKFGVDNPNLKILEEMKQAGINLYACGQSVTGLGIDPKTINPNFEVVLSRATTVSTRQMKGYAFFKF